MIRDVHARQLLALSDGDAQWLTAVASAARRRARSSAGLCGSLALVRRRLQRRGNRRWRFALSALTRESRANVAAHWTAGADMADEATALLADARGAPEVRIKIMAEAHRILAEADWVDLVGENRPVPDRAPPRSRNRIRLRLPARPSVAGQDSVPDREHHPGDPVP